MLGKILDMVLYGLNRYPEVVALMEEQLKVMYRKTDKEKDVFWKAWRKNVNSIWK